jgi:ABC-type glycerol-3-phosphate transport system permease component
MIEQPKLRTEETVTPKPGGALLVIAVLLFIVPFLWGFVQSVMDASQRRSSGEAEPR